MFQLYKSDCRALPMPLLQNRNYPAFLHKTKMLLLLYVMLFACAGYAKAGNSNSLDSVPPATIYRGVLSLRKDNNVRLAAANNLVLRDRKSVV